MNDKWEEVTERALAAVKAMPKREQSQKTEGEVFDAPTMRTFYQLISHGHLDTLDHCISTGKEANVFRGTTPEGAAVAVKVYRVFTSTFRSHQDYLWGDPRFQHRAPNKRELVSMWAGKEFKNLTRYLDIGCKVPTPMLVRDNVLLMEFVGDDDGNAAPLLKDVLPAHPQAAFDELIAFVHEGWVKGKLVHGDLSEFNVLVHGDELIVIDTAQAVLRAHPRAQELLERDVHNLTRHFKRLGVRADAKAIIADVLSAGRPQQDEEE